MSDSILCGVPAEDASPGRLEWWAGHLSRPPVHLRLPGDLAPSAGAGTERSRVVTPWRIGGTPTDVPLDEPTLVAAVAVLLYRFTSSDDLIIGRDAIGAGMLPLRLSIDPDLSFRELRALVSSVTDEAAAHGAPELPEICRRLGVGETGSAPLVQVAVRHRSGLPPLPGSRLEVALGSDATDAQSCLAWEFDRDHLDQAAVEEIADRLSILVGAALESPDSRIADLDLVGPDERHRLVVELTGPTTAPITDSLVSRIDEQCRLRPGAPAVACGPDSLSYRELGERSGRLARHLSGLGVRPGDRVGVFCDRSVDLVVALVGVMRAGAAYVPVDPGYPADRIAFMLADAQVSAVVTQAGLEAQLPEPDAPVVRIGTDGAEAASAGGEPLPVVGPGEVAYVIYTSGSTGRPKGVMVEHAGVVNLLDEMARRPGLSAGQVMVGLTTPAFDLSVPDLFLPLVTGATLVLAPVAETRDPVALARLFDEVGADLVQATPATWRMLCESGWAGRPTLRVVCGGEGYGADLARMLLDRVGEVWNCYGPTEATVWSVCTRLGPDVSDPVPMGRPLANTTGYVLDERRRPVPHGVAGELYLGGVGLARGYLGRPELTRERFVPDPFADRPGARMYRTGDLVRVRGDGALSFVGRTDHQVKLRGYRIELGEIESALTARAGIAQAVAVVREDQPGDRRLVAYVVGADLPAPRALAEELAGLLPAYMVPAAIVPLDALPLTPNGKLDRSALPEPEWGQAGLGMVAPRDELEAEVAAVCHEVIGAQPFGVTDDFFALGLDSIMAARLFTKIERTFRSELPLAAVFQAPSVAQIAELLRDGTRSPSTPDWSALVPIRAGGTRRPFFAVHGGAGTTLLFYPLAQHLEAEQPFYGIQAVGLYGRETPQTSVGEVAGRYLSEIRSVQPHGPYSLGGYCFGGLVAYEMATRLQAAGEQVELVAMFNAPAPTYNRRFNPVFDNEGALTNDRGESVERVAARRVDRSVGATIKRQLGQTAGLNLASRTVAVAGATRQRLRGPWMRTVRAVQLQVALRLRRPLPDGLREANTFQRIARTAQDRYEPGKVDLPIIVFRAQGLYFEPALGWEEYSDNILACVEVPGDQPVPRRTMREPCVEHVATHLTSRLARPTQSRGSSPLPNAPAVSTPRDDLMDTH